MTYGPWNNSKSASLNYFLECLSILTLDGALMLKLLSLHNFLYNVRLEAFSKYGVSLAAASLSISKDSRIESSKHALETVLYSIEDLSLGCSLVKNMVESRFEVVRVV